MAGTLIGRRCNPYGAETGGPKRVLGGLYGARSAEAPGQGLPDAAAQGEWPCEQKAEVRCRMRCRCGHQGQVMELCSWHDEVNYHGEVVAGKTRQTHSNIRVRGHFEEIQRRQSGLCPRCAYPGEYAALAKAVQAWEAELSALFMAQRWGTRQAQQIRQRIEAATVKFDEGRALGIIHNCPLTLEQVA